jgi:ATP-binding cassette subfamily F protein uup
MAGAPIVVAQNLGKAFGTRVLLRDVRLSIHDSDRVGLVGINGAGKSTLARILAGVETPDEGKVATRGNARVAYLAQEPVFEGDPTAYEAVLSGLGAWKEALDLHEEATLALETGRGNSEALAGAQADAALEVERLGGFSRGHAAEAMLARLGVVDTTQKVSAMSGGERRRVALARILVAQPNLAILDEPTNHLDADTVEWLEGHLARDYPFALLVVTHDRYLLDAVCTRTLELDQGEVFDYEGGWSAYLTAKSERLAQEARTESNRQNFLRTELDWLRRSPKARTTKQKARVDRAEAARDASPIARREDVTALSLVTEDSAKRLLTLEDLTVDVAGRRLVDSLSLVIQKGQRIGIVGPNGAGKTTLLRTILGDVAPLLGRVIAAKRTRFAYFDQARSGLDPELSVRDNVAPGAEVVTLGDRTVPLVAWLDRFLFSADVQKKKLSVLSGGERARVALAKLLLLPANLFLFDEPTNDLDVQTLAALEDMLTEKDAAALIVTHDRAFLDRVATSILSFEGDGIVRQYAGGYSDYRRLRDAYQAEQQVVRSGAAAAPAPGPSKPSKPKKKGLTYGEALELEALLSRIDVAEAEVKRLEAELSNPGLYAARGTEVPKMNDALARARTEAEALIARWEALEEKKAE